MSFLVVSHQKPNLKPDQLKALYGAIEQFHAHPGDVVVEADYVLADRSGSYSVVSVPDQATLNGAMSAFEGLVDVEVREVMPAG